MPWLLLFFYFMFLFFVYLTFIYFFHLIKGKKPSMKKTSKKFNYWTKL